MKLNWAERLVVNNPVRVMIQRRIIKWIKGVIRISPQSRVLEIGCGRGAGACLIQAEFHPASLHAFDLDQRMIRLAGRYLKAESEDKIFLYVGDASTLPYRDGVLDAVFGFGVLHTCRIGGGACGKSPGCSSPAAFTSWRSFIPNSIRTFWPGGSFCTRNTTVFTAMT